jgi:hypothetical protein
LDEAIAALADAQYGVVAYRQLLEVGLGRDGIAARLRTGRLHRIHRGVHSVGHRSLRREASHGRFSTSRTCFRRTR